MADSTLSTVAAEICYSDNDFDVVKIAADMLSADIENVTGRRLVKVSTPKNAAIVVGTLGKNPVLDKIIKPENVHNYIKDFATKIFGPDLAPKLAEILPTLHVYEGRDARYAVQLADYQPTTFSIHEGDFTSEWWLNVLRGYASRTIKIPDGATGKQRLRIFLLDPGIVLEEIEVR